MHGFEEHTMPSSIQTFEKHPPLLLYTPHGSTTVSFWLLNGHVLLAHDGVGDGVGAGVSMQGTHGPLLSFWQRHVQSSSMVHGTVVLPQKDDMHVKF